MDHNEAVKIMATERYLLGELDSGSRDAFEEHFFSCEECALDVRIGAKFMQEGKEVARRSRPEPIPARAADTLPLPVKDRKPGWTDWLGWLRPAFAAPAFAVLLLVIGFQNLVQVPELKTTIARLNAPEALPSVYLASGIARSGEQKTVTVKAGEPFVILIDIPGNSSSGYTAELYDAAGGKKWSLEIPGSVPTETLPLRIPSAGLSSGEWSLLLKGTNGDQVAKYTFDLKLQ